MQRKVLPPIIEYAWRWNLPSFVQQATNILNQPDSMPMTMSLLRSAFLGEKNHDVLNYVRTEMEKSIIKGFFDKMETATCYVHTRKYDYSE